MEAIIRAVNKAFCHATPVNGHERIFVHQSECNFMIEDCLPDDIIEIGHVDRQSRDTRGYNVTWVERPELPAVSGMVIYADPVRKIGFLRPDGSTAVGTNTAPGDVMFHISCFADYRDRQSKTFKTLRVGHRLSGVTRDTPRGPRAERLQRIDIETGRG